MSRGAADFDHRLISGILNIDKPTGMTSHDVVAYLRRLIGQRRIGHAGTLDPMATGVLLLCLGQATRVAEYLLTGRKKYLAVVHLGVATDTYDAEGSIAQRVESFTLSREEITEALSTFQGQIQQVPPPYSAIRKQGRRLYELARQGILVQTPPRQVEVDKIEFLAWDPPELTLRITCSPGTYIRSLAHDLGQVLKVGGHLTALRRLASGNWRLEEAVKLDDLTAAIQTGAWLQLLHPVDAALQDLERVDLSVDLVQRVSQGQAVELKARPETHLARAYAPGDTLVAILKPSSKKPGLWQPKKVFHTLSNI
jgi:tRNA pseudouridine55 synthase